MFAVNVSISLIPSKSPMSLVARKKTDAKLSKIEYPAVGEEGGVRQVPGRKGMERHYTWADVPYLAYNKESQLFL